VRLYGLIGYPLSHSFSESYFTEKFAREGLTGCRYKLFPLTHIAQVADLLKTPGLKGLNITIPYKQGVLDFIDDKSHLPKDLDACNCIKIKDGKVIGFNTDVTGFRLSFMPLVQSHHRHALILGNGGAAQAVKYVLQQNNIAYKIVSRSLHAGSDLTYDELTPVLLGTYTVIINTTPLGMYPAVGSCPVLPYKALTHQHYLFDLTYNPAKTLFLQKGEAAGAIIANGAEMLKIQAEESWRIWNEE
jgi:shikimate dehydrogenase